MRSALVGSMGVITERPRYGRLPRPTAMAQQANGKCVGRTCILGVSLIVFAGCSA